MFGFDIRSKILQNNIFGVDLDPKAVEIAKLNLMIKALDGIKPNDIKGKHLLPRLNLNIRCGNSLIGGEVIAGNEKENLFDKYKDEINNLVKLKLDFHKERDDKKKNILLREIEIKEELINRELNSKLNKYIDNPEKHKPFNYSVGFAEIMRDGGFDAVIGNPPYIDSERMVRNGQGDVRDYIKNNYKWTKGNWDIYIAFFEKGFNTVKSRGVLAYITPDKWLAKPFGDTFRENIFNHIYSILETGHNVFESANVDSVVTIFQKKLIKNMKILYIKEGSISDRLTINKEKIKSPYRLDSLFSSNLDLLFKIEAGQERLKQLAICENACSTADAYKIKPLLKDLKTGSLFNQDKHYKVVNTGTIGKYKDKWGLSQMTYLKDKYLNPVVDKTQFEKEFSNSYSEKSKKSKVIIKGLTLLHACLDKHGVFIPGKSTLVIPSTSKQTLKILLGFLNSKLPIFYIKEKYPAATYNQGINFTKEMINELPIGNLMEHTEELLKLVGELLNITQQEDFDFNDPPNDFLLIEEGINMLMYKIHNLTDEDVKVIENSFKK